MAIFNHKIKCVTIYTRQVKFVPHNSHIFSKAYFLGPKSEAVLLRFTRKPMLATDVCFAGKPLVFTTILIRKIKMNEKGFVIFKM